MTYLPLALPLASPNERRLAWLRSAKSVKSPTTVCVIGVFR
jgi:hypothetical protein